MQLLSFFCPLNCASNKPSNFKHFTNTLWCKSLKVFCKSNTLISLLHPRGTLNNASLHNYLKQKWIKLFCNIKTRWIFVFSPAKRVVIKYMSLVVKMMVISMPSKLWELFLGSCVMSKLPHASPTSCQCWKVMHELIKFVQSCETFVCDFMGVVMMCCVDLYTFYYDL